jgi:hypothetical protein
MEEDHEICFKGHAHGLCEAVAAGGACRLHAARVRDLDRISQPLPERLKRRLTSPGVAVEHPGAELFVRFVGHRSDHGQRSHPRGIYRQRVIGIVEQHDTLDRRFVGELQPVLKGRDRKVVGCTIGPLEQAEPRLYHEDMGHHAIQLLQRDSPLLDELLEVVQIGLAGHFHVDSG